jgi:hypothetical protein
MKRFLTATALLALAAGPAWADGVTKEDVRKMVAAGAGDDLILALVASHGTFEKLSADDVIDLKRAGASDKLVEGLLVASMPQPTATPADPEEPAIVVLGAPAWWSGEFPRFARRDCQPIIVTQVHVVTRVDCGRRYRGPMRGARTYSPAPSGSPRAPGKPCRLR